MTARGSDRRHQFVEALRSAVAERAERGEPFDEDAVLDAVGQRMGAILVRSTYEPPRVPAPFPEPDGFMYPRARPRRMTAPRRDRLIGQLREGKRPETRNAAAFSLGGALDDPVVISALRTASRDDPSILVRGDCLLNLGLSGSESPDSLLAAAQRLVADAETPRPRGHWDHAGVAAAILGALVGASRDGRQDMVGPLRLAAGSIDGGDQWRARMKRSLLYQIDALDAAIA